MLTVADLREHVTSTLGDGALEMLLAAAYEVIDERAGSEADVTELIYAGPGPLLLLSRKARAVVSVTEGDTTLVATDYALRGRMMLRLDTGANPSRQWTGRVDVTYSPIVSQDRRDAAAVALVSLGLDNSTSGTAQSERIGDWTETFSDAAETREKRDNILAELTGSSLVIL